MSVFRVGKFYHYNFILDGAPPDALDPCAAVEREGTGE